MTEWRITASSNYIWQAALRRASAVRSWYMPGALEHCRRRRRGCTVECRDPGAASADAVSWRRQLQTELNHYYMVSQTCTNYRTKTSWNWWLYSAACDLHSSWYSDSLNCLFDLYISARQYYHYLFFNKERHKTTISKLKLEWQPWRMKFKSVQRLRSAKPFSFERRES